LEEKASLIHARDIATMTHLVKRCCEIKAAVVREDEKEHGLRAILNLGHTTGHALEALSGYGRLRHGEAVAMGLVVAARLSRRLGLLAPEAEEAVARLLSNLGLPTTLPRIAASDIIAAMSVDKKTQAGVPRFVLLTALGKAQWGVTVPRPLLRATLRELGAT
jgi:3-dehydroquinate synthase